MQILEWFVLSLIFVRYVVNFCILHNNNKCYLHLFFHFFYICKKKLEKSKAWEEYYCKKVPKYFCASKTSLYAKVLRNWRQHNLFFTLVKIAVSNFRLVLFGDFLMDFTAFQFLMNIVVFKCKPTTIFGLIPRTKKYYEFQRSARGYNQSKH